MKIAGILLLCSLLLAGTYSIASEKSFSAAESDQEMKQWFADVMWKKFIAERDPRLKDVPYSYEEIDAFVDEVTRSGGGVALSMEDLTRLVKYRDKLCESKDNTYGFDLDRL